MHTLSSLRSRIFCTISTVSQNLRVAVDVKLSANIWRFSSYWWMFWHRFMLMLHTLNSQPDKKWYNTPSMLQSRVIFLKNIPAFYFDFYNKGFAFNVCHFYIYLGPVNYKCSSLWFFNCSSSLNLHILFHFSLSRLNYNSWYNLFLFSIGTCLGRRRFGSWQGRDDPWRLYNATWWEFLCKSNCKTSEFYELFKSRDR